MPTFSILPDATVLKPLHVYPAILLKDIPATFSTAYGFWWDFVEQTGEFIEDEFGAEEKVIIKKGAKCGIYLGLNDRFSIMSPRGGATLAFGIDGIDWIHDKTAYPKR